MKAVWKGALSFGLVNIPINLYSGSKERAISFHLLHKKDLSPVRYSRICSKEKKEVPWEEIVKGYEISSGKWIVLTDDDFEKANVRKTRTIDIIDFTGDEIDPIYYEKPYFLEPQKNAEKAYVLLREALGKSKKLGIAHFVMRHHEHIGVIRPYKNLLVLNQLRYSYELENEKHINIPQEAKIMGKELQMALDLINHLTGHFHPEKYKDTYTEELLEIIKEKAHGKISKIRGKTPVATKKTELFKALEDSLREKKKAA